MALRPNSTLDGTCWAEASSIDVLGRSEIGIALAGLHSSPEQSIKREFGIVYAFSPRLCPSEGCQGKQRAAAHQMDQSLRSMCSRHSCHAGEKCCIPPVSKNLHIVALTGVPKQVTFST